MVDAFSPRISLSQLSKPHRCYRSRRATTYWERTRRSSRRSVREVLRSNHCAANRQKKSKSNAMHRNYYCCRNHVPKTKNVQELPMADMHCSSHRTQDMFHTVYISTSLSRVYGETWMPLLPESWCCLAPKGQKGNGEH